MTDLDLWWVTLGAGLAVALVVAVLVTAIFRVVSRIRRTVDGIWIAGAEIANNTATLDLLRRMNHVAADTLATAERIAGAAPGEGGKER